MTTILPSARTPWDVISEQIGGQLNKNLPGILQESYQRQRGMNALDQAQAEIGQAGGDPYKIALAFARVGAQNPALERSLGPLMQTAMANAKVNRAFPTGTQQNVTQQVSPEVPQIPQQNITGNAQAQPSTFATPSAFNVMTPDEIDAESRRYAQALQDPNAYQTRQSQLQNKNIQAQEQRSSLEDMALKSDIRPDELPRFMLVGSKFDPRNPSEWMQNTKRAFEQVKSNDKKLQNTFIPGLGSGLLGRNREKALKRLQEPIQDQIKNGLERETRNYLADQYLSPTEIEQLIHPLTPEKEKALKSLPKGIFEKEKGEMTTERGFPERKKSPIISYEEARERAPKELQIMQNRLSDFFQKNVDDNTSLLVLRDKLWNDKDYDWQQIGPAIRQAMENGLKLNSDQLTEMATIESQPPIQSLPDIFQDLDRVTQYFRGNK